MGHKLFIGMFHMAKCGDFSRVLFQSPQQFYELEPRNIGKAIKILKGKLIFSCLLYNEKYIQNSLKFGIFIYNSKRDQMSLNRPIKLIYYANLVIMFFQFFFHFIFFPYILGLNVTHKF